MALSISDNEKRYIAFIFLACVLLFAVICLAFQSSALMKTHQNIRFIDDIKRSLNSNLSDIRYASVCVSLNQWNEILTNLHDVDSNMEDKLAMDVSGIILNVIVLALVVGIFLLMKKVRYNNGEPGATTPLIPVTNMKRQSSFPSLPVREAGRNAASGPSPSKPSRKASAAMMHEGALYEPWNQTTLDKLSSENELLPAAKVTRAAYRYGPIAGRIMLRRFGHLLNETEQLEVNRILNLGPA